MTTFFLKNLIYANCTDFLFCFHVILNLLMLKKEKKVALAPDLEKERKKSSLSNILYIYHISYDKKEICYIISLWSYKYILIITYLIIWFVNTAKECWCDFFKKYRFAKIIWKKITNSETHMSTWNTCFIGPQNTEVNKVLICIPSFENKFYIILWWWIIISTV